MEIVTEHDFLACATKVLGGKKLSLTSRREVDWDSVGHFNLLMEIEARWNVRVPMERVAQIETLGDFYRLLPYRPAKVLAVDADGVLWQGVVSEDGPDKIKPKVAFQSTLQALRQRGVLLVLLSKNDPVISGSPLALAFAREDMPLSLDDFTLVLANWEPKPNNLQLAARTIGVFPDAFVFVDDNPRERAEMRATLPEVMTPDFPPPPLDERYFAKLGETPEDRLRSNWRPLASADPSYLQTLNLEVIPSFATEADIPRLVQMAAKTNRFNATTRRRTENEFRALITDSACRVFTFRCRDRFGDMGLVCYAVVTKGQMTDLVMSCRALGRTLEWFVWRHIVAVCGKAPVVMYVPNERNTAFAEFYNAILSGAIGDTFFRQP